MTDNEIIKALECCKKDDCDNCPNDFGNCYANLAGYALDLINHQKAEIEKLTMERDLLSTPRTTIVDMMSAYDKGFSEAVKECAERVYKTLTAEEVWRDFKNAWLVNGECDWLKHKLGNIVKELDGNNVGAQGGQK